jgi:molybdenum cofactor cytidylyltransferase
MPRSHWPKSVTASDLSGHGEIGDVAVVILAAGDSSRFGSPKQLAVVNNRPFIEHCVRTATGLVAADRIVVVTGACHEQVCPVILATGVRTVHNEQWRDGMAGSIRVAIKNLPESIHAVLLMTCDQVLITPAQYRELLGVWRQHTDSPVASSYAGTVGIPAIFPRRLFAELCRLQGDVGAKKVLHQHDHEMYSVAIDEARYDIDTVEDMINAGLLEDTRE